MIKVTVVGLGPIGISAAGAIRRDPHMQLVGLVDLDPAKVGQSVHDLDINAPAGGPKVTPTLDDTPPADVVIACTSSYFADMMPLVRECTRRGSHLVSSCEEMLWPWYRSENLAAEADELARSKNVALLGTGVNPGFVLDLLPVVLSSMVLEVSYVRAVRRVDARRRRKPLQQKVGATMSVEQFNQLKAQGKIGHKGMAESVAMLAAGLGLGVSFGQVVETLEPVVAEEPIESLLGIIMPGQVAGMHNVGKLDGDGLGIELDLTMSCGLDQPGDSVYLHGPVPLELHIPDSTPGDSATVAALVNSTRAIVHARPGLRTMLDLGRVVAARHA